ncbi:glycosyltransferase family 2 protein [Streptomyces sp. ms191]|uniref:glycosyltransferase family 2 protein n=1 Tax=Streptomyces sp. ms191 TaxID=1827978 RepID=UPI0011CDEB3A|nr:glycosyltransferase family 2 protein [Streptomyces sp. ms191]TXS32273.1 glycosyltransferase family 2 protein [Streptomyces sp. ms191]
MHPQYEAADRGPVAVLVVTWNSAAVLPGFLAALPKAMAGLDWRLVVADNDSADDTVAVVRALAPEATVVETGRNGGYSFGVNAALRAAGDWEGGFSAALVCNPDIRMSEGCAATLVDALGTEPADGDRVGIAVPLLYEEDDALIHSLRRESSVSRAFGEAVLGNRRAGRFPALSELVTDPAAYAGRTRADWATGALMAISRECLDACGPWDESFFLYSEETEFCLRARDLGHVTRLEPAARAVHLGGDSRVSPRLWSLLTVNRVRLYRRRHGFAATVAFRGAVLLRELSRAALGRAPSRAAVVALLTTAATSPAAGGQSRQEV